MCWQPCQPNLVPDFVYTVNKGCDHRDDRCNRRGDCCSNNYSDIVYSSCYSSWLSLSHPGTTVSTVLQTIVINRDIHCISKKFVPWCLITLANVDQFLHQLIRKKIFCVRATTISISSAICCYTSTLPCQKSKKMLLIWQQPQQTVDMFLRIFWGVD